MLRIKEKIKISLQFFRIIIIFKKVQNEKKLEKTLNKSASH